MTPQHVTKFRGSGTIAVGVKELNRACENNGTDVQQLLCPDCKVNAWEARFEKETGLLRLKCAMCGAGEAPLRLAP